VASLSALVGDRRSDIEAARAAGLGAAVLLDRSGSQGAAAAGAAAIARSLGEAVAFIAEARAKRVPG
jgi:phosphoglycolate phosphatase-like HAD superfamily hydrolase